MKYILVQRNESCKANSNEEFVTWMRRCDIEYHKENSDFMTSYARRKSLFEDVEIRFDHEDHFVEDLQKNEFLKIEKKPKWKLF